MVATKAVTNLSEANQSAVQCVEQTVTLCSCAAKQFQKAQFRTRVVEVVPAPTLLFISRMKPALQPLHFRNVSQRQLQYHFCHCRSGYHIRSSGILKSA